MMASLTNDDAEQRNLNEDERFYPKRQAEQERMSPLLHHHHLNQSILYPFLVVIQ